MSKTYDYNGRAEYTGNPWRKWADIHRDFKTLIDGERYVLVNFGDTISLVPWIGGTK